MSTAKNPLFAIINGNYHSVDELADTIYYFGKPFEIVEDQDGDKYFLFGKVAIYINGFSIQTGAERLSSAFSKILREWLTPAEMEEINTANELSTDPRLCESHKYCDAHEAMSQAFQLTFGRSIDYRYDTDTNMINEAWRISKAMKFLN